MTQELDRKQVLVTPVRYDNTGYRKSSTVMHQLVDKFVTHSSARVNFLLKRVQFDPIEVFLVLALWCNIAHRLYWGSIDKGSEFPKVYDGMTMILGGQLYTAILVFLGLLGLMAFMLYLPKLRRETDLAIATYFVVTGVVLLCNVHDSLLGIYHILVFGISGIWTYWRQGNRYDRL